MNVLNSLEPQNVFRFFEEIASIPHGSNNLQKISDYLVAFANERNLKVIRDEALNVIIFKDGTAGYETSAPVILQGHIDMVAVKEENCRKNLETEGLDLEVSDGFISAKGTSLGGDDGIAVAYALAVLDSDTIAHPPLEVVITTNEEIGLLGAAALDCSVLKGRIMLNMDSEDEGIFTAGCAGGATADMVIPVAREAFDGVKMHLELKDFKGGHSGQEINAQRANANKILGRILLALKDDSVSFRLITANGGEKDNAIARFAAADLAVAAEDVPKAKEAVLKITEIVKSEYHTTDVDAKITFTEDGKAAEALDADSTLRVIRLLHHTPYGVMKYSYEIKGLVQTSLNCGVFKFDEAGAHLIFSVRSSVSSEKDELLGRLSDLAELLGGKCNVYGAYPAWEYRADSKVRDLIVDDYKKLTGKEPRIEVIHAGLECGMFSDKLPGLDAISFGPDMDDIHTFHEKLNIESAKRGFELLVEVLKDLK